MLVDEAVQVSLSGALVELILQNRHEPGIWMLLEMLRGNRATAAEKAVHAWFPDPTILLVRPLRPMSLPCGRNLKRRLPG